MKFRLFLLSWVPVTLFFWGGKGGGAGAQLCFFRERGVFLLFLSCFSVDRLPWSAFRGPSSVGPTQNVELFAILPPQNPIFSPSLGGSSLNSGGLLGVFDAQGPQHARLGSMAHRVKPWPPTRPGRRSSHKMDKRTQNVHVSGPSAANTTQNSTRRRSGRRKRGTFWTAEGKTNA